MVVIEKFALTITKDFSVPNNFKLTSNSDATWYISVDANAEVIVHARLKH